MTLVALQVEGDATALAAAMETVKREIGRLVCPESDSIVARAADARASLTGRDAGPTKEDNQARRESADGAHPQKKHGILRAEKKTQAEACATGGQDKGPRAGSMQEKALAVIRSSHQGVTSEEIYKSVGCATIQSAYQLCLELERKSLIERTPAGAWKAISG